MLLNEPNRNNLSVVNCELGLTREFYGEVLKGVPRFLSENADFEVVMRGNTTGLTPSPSREGRDPVISLRVPTGAKDNRISLPLS